MVAKSPTRNVEVTIDLVAESAGVSRATVSRVINGSAKVSPETEKAVRKAIKKYNFVPNTTARRLAGGRSGLVALVLEESSEEFFLNPFWGLVVQGFTTAISDAGMQPLLLIRPKTGSEDSLFESLRKAQVDGIAMFSWHRSVRSFERLLPAGVPVVFGGDLGGSDKFPYVDVDNVQGGYLATKHLIAQGCKKIITITGDLKLQSGRDRFEGFEKAMSEAGREISPATVLTGDYSTSTAEEVMREFLKKKITFDGIFAGNDLSALGAINVLLQNKIQVPKQVKVIGFDNSPVATRSNPPLSSIHQPTRELGAEVANMLVALLGGAEVNKKMLQVKLVQRESTAKS